MTSAGGAGVASAGVATASAIFVLLQMAKEGGRESKKERKRERKRMVSPRSWRKEVCKSKARAVCSFHPLQLVSRQHGARRPQFCKLPELAPPVSPGRVPAPAFAQRGYAEGCRLVARLFCISTGTRHAHRAGRKHSPRSDYHPGSSFSVCTSSKALVTARFRRGASSTCATLHTNALARPRPGRAARTIHAHNK